MYCTRVTVTSRQFVTQEVESENVTLNLRLGGGVEGREECKATVRIPQPRRDSERRKKGRKRRAAQPAQVHQHLHQHMQSAPAPAVNTVQCPLYSVHCSVYTVNCGLFTVHCTLYTVHRTVYTVHCTLYTVHCKMYTCSGEAAVLGEHLAEGQAGLEPAEAAGSPAGGGQEAS